MRQSRVWVMAVLGAAVVGVGAAAEQPVANPDVFWFEPPPGGMAWPRVQVPIVGQLERARERRAVMEAVQAQNQFAQVPDGGAILPQGAGADGAVGEGVYVPDSGKAAERMRLAERLEGQREWGKAAEVYQEVVEQLGDRVVAVEGTKGRFVTVARRVEERVAGWPAEGLAAYRAKFEPAARAMLEAGGGVGGAGDGVGAGASRGASGGAEVVERYFATSAALEAGVRLVDERLESGDFAGAWQLAWRLLSGHPDVRRAGPVGEGVRGAEAGGARGGAGEPAPAGGAGGAAPAGGAVGDAARAGGAGEAAPAGGVVGEAARAGGAGGAAPAGGVVGDAARAGGVGETARAGGAGGAARAGGVGEAAPAGGAGDAARAGGAGEGSRGGAGVGGRAGLLMRGVLASAWAGEAEASRGLMAELEGTYSEAVGVVGGRQVRWAEAAREALAARGAVGRRGLAGWTMPGGDATRAGVSGSGARAVGRMGGVPLPGAVRPRSGEGVNERTRTLAFGGEQETFERTVGAGVVVMPSADRGELFFQDGLRVWGVSLDTGMPLAGWAETHGASGGGGRPAGVYVGGRGVGPLRNFEYSVTLTEGSVLAVVGQVEMRANPEEVNWGGRSAGDVPVVRLVRLDRATGAEVWAADLRRLPDGQAGLRGLVMSGSPVVVGDAVYVSARGSKGDQFDDAYVLSFEYATGRLKWGTYLASAANPVPAFRERSASPPTVSHVAASGSKLFVQTNLGAVACVDAGSGRPDWLSLYGREADALPRAGGRGGWGGRGGAGEGERERRGWGYNPPVVSGGLVFSLPTDGRDVTVYEAGTGKVAGRVPRAAYGNATVLIHADEKRVLLASETEVWAVAWGAEQPDPTVKASGLSGAVLWRSRLNAPLRGRPFIAGDRLLVPTQARLVVLDLSRDGKVMPETIPANPGKWTGIEGQGNVVAAGGQVVIAGQAEVEIWSDPALAEAEYRSEVAATPRAAVPRVRRAEAVFSVGRVDEAIAALEEAVSLIPGDPRAVEARRRLYGSASAMAERALAGDVDPVAARRTALRMLDLAGRAATSPVQQVEWRRKKTELLAGENASDAELTEAVGLWQSVLEEPEWRAVRVADGPAGLVPAGRVAFREIGEVVRRWPAAYAEWEKRAAAALAEAGSGASGLLAVASAYPNAAVAPDAMLRAAAIHEAEGDLRQAGLTLRELYFHYPAFTGRGDVVEAMARVSLATPGRRETAMARLALAARLVPDRAPGKPMLLPDGTPLQGSTMAELAESMRAAMAAEASGALPDFRLPDDRATEAYRREKRGQIEALTPAAEVGVKSVVAVLESRGRARADRVVAQLVASELAVLSPEKGVLWRARTASPRATGCAWFGETLVVWDATTVSAYDGTGAEGGKLLEPLWRVAAGELPAPATGQGLAWDGEDPEAGGDGPMGVQGGAVVVQQRGANGGWVQVRMIRRGPMWVPAPNLNVLAGGRPGVGEPGEAFVTAVVAGERLVLGTSEGRLVAVSPADGRVVWQTRAGDEGARRLMAGEDFVVASFSEGTAVRVSAVRTEDGSAVWSRVFSDVARMPQNATLSPDGVLLMTTPGQILAKDLFEAGSQLTFETPVDVSTPFTGMVEPGHLAVWEGVLLAATDQGQFVRGYVIAEGCRPVRFPSSEDTGAARFATRAVGTANGAPETTRMRVVGRQLYVQTSRSVVSYDLSSGVESWHKPVEEGTAYVGLTVGEGFVLATTSPRPVEPGSAVYEVRLRAFSTSRDTAGGRESGKLVHQAAIREVAGEESGATVFPVEGGVFVLGRDRALKLWRGTR